VLESLKAVASVEDDPTIAPYVPEAYRAKRAVIRLMDRDRVVVGLSLSVGFHDVERLKRLATEIADAINDRCISVHFP
jgi:adenylylsulfate kinase-like enzyme